MADYATRLPLRGKERSGLPKIANNKIALPLTQREIPRAVQAGVREYNQGRIDADFGDAGDYATDPASELECETI